MAEENTNTDQSDFEKVEAYLKERVHSLYEEERKATSTVPTQSTQSQPSAQEQQNAALREYLLPAMEPELKATRQAMFEAADAKDMMSVMNDPLYVEYQKEVDDIFDTMKKQGRPFPRRDILRHVMGKEFTENPEKFTERTGKVKKAQLARASEAVDVGAGGVGRNGGSTALPSLDEFAKLPSDEQAKYLEGVTF